MSTPTVSRPDALAEGKTKIIWPHPDNRLHVLIESKNDITAGDGAKHDLLEGKGAAANETTCNVFRLLQKDNLVPTHFHGQTDEVTFEAVNATMIPIEVVVRRVAFGSYLKRNPEATSGARLPHLAIEFFHKDDSAHDPLMVYRSELAEFWLYDPKQPVSEATKLGTLHRDKLCRKFGLTDNVITLMRITAARVFELLERAWLKQSVSLVDLKVEFGYDHLGRLLLADVIDNDSWRIWPNGQTEDMLDKQVYRDLQASDENAKASAMAQILDNYRRVAKLTGNF